jgi:hypothetical protein
LTQFHPVTTVAPPLTWRRCCTCAAWWSALVVDLPDRSFWGGRWMRQATGCRASGSIRIRRTWEQKERMC